MRDNRKALLIALTAGAIVVGVIVGACTGSVLGWLVSTVVLLIIPLAMYLSLTRSETSAQPAQATPATQVDLFWRQQQVHGVALPSARDDYQFQFAALIHWQPAPGRTGSPSIDQELVAAEAILTRAREITQRTPPERLSLLRYELPTALGNPSPDRRGAIFASATNITVALSDDDVQRLTRAADLQRLEEQWEREHAHERSKRRYLREDVLVDTGTALVWWLSRHDNEIRKAVDLIGPLHEICAVANGAEPGGASEWLAGPADETRDHADLFDSAMPFDGTHLSRATADLMRELDIDPHTPEGALFARRIAQSMTAAGRRDAADDIRRRFDTTAFYGKVDEDTDSGVPAGPPDAPSSPPTTGEVTDSGEDQPQR